MKLLGNQIVKKERIIWIGITAFLVVVLLALCFTPAVLAQSIDDETQEAIAIFQDVFNFVRDNYVDYDKTDVNNLLEGALKGLFESLDDPYSAYITGSELRDLTDTSTGKFGGVGLQISKGDKYIVVVSPIEGTPAYNAGISAGDLIIGVEDESTEKLSLDEVVLRLRGTPGTSVTVTIQRNDNLIFNVTLERGIIEIPVVKYDMIDNEIAYLRIIEFTPLTAEKVKEALLDFKKQSYKALVIDLRFNPGGLLQSTVDIANFFLSSGPIVSTRGRDFSNNSVYSASSNTTIVDYNIPVMVLVDGGSASASEILAGALKDTKRAILIGEKTYGKGSVQQVRMVGEGAFRLTTSLYYTPAGIRINKIGIEPDIEIKEPELTEEEKTSIERLYNENTIELFVKKNSNPTEKQITNFLQELKDSGIVLREIILRRWIRREVYRKDNNPPVFDLDYDPVLIEAVKVLRQKLK